MRALETVYETQLQKMKTTFINDTTIFEWLKFEWKYWAAPFCGGFIGRFNFVIYPIFVKQFSVVQHSVTLFMRTKWHSNKRVGGGAAAIKLIPFQLIPEATCNHCCTWQNNDSTHQIRKEKSPRQSASFIDCFCLCFNIIGNNGLQQY